MPQKETEILNLLSKPLTKKKGFDKLLKNYQQQLYWQIKELTKTHEDTNDVLQNVLIKVWRYIDGFKGDSKLSSWLYRIARNETISFLNKKNKRQIANLNDKTKNFIFESIKAETYTDSKTIYDSLILAVATLPKKQKLVFEMRYFKELKYKDMSIKLNISQGALKASYHHAVKKIEAFLKTH